MSDLERRLLRGTWLDKTIDIERILNDILTTFFHVNGRFRVAFESLVLDAMSLSSKVEAVRVIIRELASFGCDTTAYANLPARLDQMVQRRNALAHRRIQQVVEIAWDDEGNASRTEKGHHVKRRKGATLTLDGMMQPFDLDQWQAEGNALDELSEPVMALFRDVIELWPHSIGSVAREGRLDRLDRDEPFG